MGKILGLAAACCSYFCVATMLAQAIGAGYMWSQGMLSRDRVMRMLAALHDVDPKSISGEAADADKNKVTEQVSHEAVLRARVAKSLDLNLRELAIEQALGELRRLEAQMIKERERYQQLKDSFDARLAELQRGASDSSIQEVQRTLEAMQPKQAKDQILMILSEDENGGDGRAMNDVVTILKLMSLDKRRKIISEFKAEDESEKLHEILRQIRLGEPEVTLIRGTREQLKGVTL